MKLSEYMEALQSVCTQLKTEAAVEVACFDETADIWAEYQAVITTFQDMIKKNRDSLGLGQLGPMSQEEQTAMKEKEIDPENLKLHVAMVRYDLMQTLTGKKNARKRSIASEILNELTIKTDTVSLKQIGSAIERQLVTEARKSASTAEPKPPPQKIQPIPPLSNEIEAINERLRQAGKIK
ncbi:hypothetical protein JXD20_00215 [Candidatus Peregrinibacteria bacterium]|nr:hypothetical protein [Candidatus Peregrinibacteria bacterium]